MNSCDANCMNLTNKQAEFCRQYLIDFNGKQAAIRAGYSEKSAKVTSSRLLTNANVQQYLTSLQKPYLDNFHITQQRIMDELAIVAFSNIMDFIAFDEEGTPYFDMSQCSERQMRALKSAKVVEGKASDKDGQPGKVKIQLWDKLEALSELLRRMETCQPVQQNENYAQQSADMDSRETAKRILFILRQARGQRQ